MADPLSIAAAGAGFVSLAGQILDGIVKLRGLYITTKNATREIHDLCDELDIFRCLLQETGSRVQKTLPAGVDASHLKDALAHCEKMRSYTESVLKRLDIVITKSRTMALKFTFKKQEIDNMLLSVERAKTSLLLANQSFESSVASHQHDILSRENTVLLSQQHKMDQRTAQVMSTTTQLADTQKQEFANISHDITASMENSTAQTRDLKEVYRQGHREICITLSRLQDSTTSISSTIASQIQQSQQIAATITDAEQAINEINARLQGTSIHRSLQTLTKTVTRTTVSFHLIPLGFTIEQSKSLKQEKVTSRRSMREAFSVRLPTWFLQEQYDLQLLRATSGWPFSLDFCRIVSWESPFFRACEKGNIKDVKILLSTKQASIYDRTARGWTAFHAAMMGGQLEICQILRQLGIFTRFRARDYGEALNFHSSARIEFTERERCLLRIIQPDNDTDPEWYQDFCEIPIGDRSSYWFAESRILGLISRAIEVDAPEVKLARMKACIDIACSVPSFLVLSLVPNLIPYMTSTLLDDAVVCAIREAPLKHTWIMYGCASEIRRRHVWDRLESRNMIQRLLSAMIGTGLDLCNLSYPSFEGRGCFRTLAGNQRTPLMALCYDPYEYELELPIEQIDWEVRQWVSALSSASINLSEYAQRVMPTLISFLNYQDRSRPVNSGRQKIQTLVSYGPNPEDWHVFFWEHTETFAELFWRSIEDKPIYSILAGKLIARMISLRHQEPWRCNIPCSWPSISLQDRLEEEIKTHLKLTSDEELVNIIQSATPDLGHDQFFGKWWELYQIRSCIERGNVCGFDDLIFMEKLCDNFRREKANA